MNPTVRASDSPFEVAPIAYKYIYMNEIVSPGRIATDSQPRLLAVARHQWSPSGDLAVEAVNLTVMAPDGRVFTLFAACCVPLSPIPLPLILHVPGGGQTVNPEDLRWWARDGIACASFDWWIGENGHDPSRKSHWPDGVVAPNQTHTSEEQAILPLAIAAGVAVLEWLADDPRIDIKRCAAVGISWGGYLTWAINAWTRRFRAVVPIYGCGGLFHPGHPWRPQANPSLAERWRTSWDAQTLAGRQYAPVCYLSGSNDFFGFVRHADDALRLLRVDHRHHLLANANHHIAPGASALAQAWIRQHLCGGEAVPPEPVLAGWEVKTGPDRRRCTTATWWTPDATKDDLACWWPGTPPIGTTCHLAFGEAVYEDGIALSTAMRRGVLQATQGETLPARWPDLRAGVTFQWQLGSTQLHRTAVERTPINDGSQERWLVARPGAGAVDIVFRGVSDPRWNRGMRSLSLGLVAEDLRDIAVTLTTIDGVARTVIQAPIRLAPAPEGVQILIEDPAIDWQAVRSVNLTAKTSRASFIVGPFVRG